MPALRRFLADRAALAGLVLILALTTLAVLGEHLAPFPEDAFEAKPWQRLEPPSATHPFGTDALGRDVLSRVILGARIAIAVALSVVFGAMAIGVPLGLVAGYRGGWAGEAIMRVTDVFQSVPQLVLALALAAILRPSLTTAMIGLTLTYWPFFTRIVYGETRRIRAAPFVEALEAANIATWRIVALHVLPNAAPAIIVRATIGMGVTILTAAALGFLGMGAEPPTPEWGLMISEARKHLPDAWWFSLFPGLAILLTVLAFNLFGDGLRDVIDPRLRRSR
jgi:peptide/nickel transport system permease protein